MFTLQLELLHDFCSEHDDAIGTQLTYCVTTFHVGLWFSLFLNVALEGQCFGKTKNTPLSVYLLVFLLLSTFS